MLHSHRHRDHYLRVPGDVEPRHTHNGDNPPGEDRKLSQATGRGPFCGQFVGRLERGEGADRGSFAGGF